MDAELEISVLWQGRALCDCLPTAELVNLLEVESGGSRGLILVHHLCSGRDSAAKVGLPG